MSEVKRAKILVIDGDASARGMITETLAARGPEVHTVADPDEGVEKAKALGPDLIFISLLFPNSNGLKLSKQIRSEEGLKKVPVIMLISYQGELDPKYTSTIGIVDVLVKPLTREDIVSKILNVLGKDALSEVEEAEILEEAPLVEEKEAASEEETAVAHVAAAETEESSASPDGGNDLRAEDEAIRGPVSEGEEIISRGVSSGMAARKRIFAAAAILIVAIIGISAYGLKKFFYLSGSDKAPISLPETSTKTREMQKASPVVGGKAGNGAMLPVKEKRAAAAVRTHGEAGEETKRPSSGVQDKQKKMPASSAEVLPQRAAHAASGKGPIFSVQVGAFGSEQNAAVLVGRLKKKGYDAFTERAGSRPVYRVLVGRFADRSKASEQAGLLEKEGIKSFIFHSRD